MSSLKYMSLPIELSLPIEARLNWESCVSAKTLPVRLRAGLGPWLRFWLRVGLWPVPEPGLLGIEDWDVFFLWWSLTPICWAFCWSELTGVSKYSPGKRAIELWSLSFIGVLDPDAANVEPDGGRYENCQYNVRSIEPLVFPSGDFNSNVPVNKNVVVLV